MKMKLYQVDAFTDRLFSGNPAAVCPLEEWPEDSFMQAIAAENNLSETAFFVKTEKGFHLRWFTPTTEVDLCGHATLAAAFVIFKFIDQSSDTILFDSLSGELKVAKEEGMLSLNFPARRPAKIESRKAHEGLVDYEPREIYFHTKTVFVLNDENEVIRAVPNLDKIAKLDSDGLIITAQGKDVDFVSRYFAPHAGIPEDPVTGAAHTVLTPLWSKKLNKKRLTAHQVSKRGGKLICEDLGNRVKLNGKAVLYSEGEIHL